jgi:hypothetical protein
MGKVSMGIISLAVLMALALVAVPSMASLIPATFGFPVMVSSGQSFSFSNDMASFTDIESINIDFNMFDGFMSTSCTPSISTDKWPMQGMASPDLGNMGKLFDFSGFKLL